MAAASRPETVGANGVDHWCTFYRGTHKEWGKQLLNQYTFLAEIDRHNVSSVIVTHDMKTVERVADRVIMLAPCRTLTPDEPQILFEGTVSELFTVDDPQIAEFVRGGALETDTDIPTFTGQAA